MPSTELQPLSSCPPDVTHERFLRSTAMGLYCHNLRLSTLRNAIYYLRLKPLF